MYQTLHGLYLSINKTKIPKPMLAQNKMKGLFVLCLLIISYTSIAQLSTNFSATPLNGCAPMIVRFTDQSTGSPTYWKWDLGNGTTSFLQNPSVTYFTPGRYTIKLVIKNGALADSITKLDYIEVGAKPTVNFTASNITGCYPLPVQFSDASIANNGTVTNWQWDFGDGNTATTQHPLHTYTTSGNFTVTLQVKNSNGCVSSLVKTAFVQISSGVLASFTNTTPSDCTAPSSVSFTNTSSGTGVLSFNWNFGDGNTSTDENPVHVYTAFGRYNVQLIVTNTNGCTDTLTKTNAVSIGTVKANFSFTDSVCVGNTIVFTNTSSPAPALVNWDFGDGTTASTISPTKIFNTANLWPVKMVANFGACTDSVTKFIKVFNKPNIVFTVNDSANCTAPFTVQFTNTSGGGARYLWDFGDGNTSTLRSPAHTYNSFGSYTVMLKATSIYGCSDSLVKTGYINIKKPVINFANLPDSGCAPLTKNFSATVNNVMAVNTYLWNFGDGNTSTLPNPTHTFTTAGIYAIKLVITSTEGCTDSTTLPKGILVGTKPIINFNVTPTISCANLPLNFSTTTPNATGYLWDFGDRTTSTLQNPTHIYQDTGYMDIKLKVWYNGCLDSIIALKHVYINPPIAKFNIGFNCSRPLERTFTDKSIGADDWNWDFGDGTTSTLQHPTHTYSSVGTYTVTLKVKNLSTGCEFTIAKQINIVWVAANFNTLNTDICRGSSTTFTTGLSISTVASFKWKFSDTSAFITTTSNSINHTFTGNGIYNITLITIDINGCSDTITKPNYINVTSPTAKFNTSNGTCVNSTVLFTDSSTTDGTNAIHYWQWNYGDGKIDSLTSGPFEHSYTQAGQYYVQLKVTDAKGCTDSLKLATPVIISKPFAYYTATNLVTCPGKIVNFGNASTGANLTYLWSFGDGTDSVAFRPAYTYLADGIYTTRLIVTDRYGCKDTMTRVNYVSIQSPKADFIMSDSIVYCPPLLVQFTDSSTNAISRVWDFGDSSSSTILSPSHFYLNAGNYTVKLTITGPGGCISVKEKLIQISGPRGTFNYTAQTGCNPLTINFTGTSLSPASYVFDFNDGSLETSVSSNISHTFTYPGSYLPKMILVDANGCQVPILGLDTIVVKGVHAKFDFSKTLLCDSGIVQFSDSSFANDIITNYSWSFGDGRTANTQNPAHTYTTVGNYSTTLIITTQTGCKDTAVTTTPITIYASPKISMLATGNGCTPLQVAFVGQLAPTDTSTVSWLWNFANGNTSTLKQPTVQVYTNGGIYPVTLIATNSVGCSTKALKNIEAYQTPIVNAGADTLLCNGSRITLAASGALNYTWSPAIGLSCTNCATPVTNTTTNTIYKVIGTTTQGCKATDSVLVTVKNKFRLNVSTPAKICNGQTSIIKANGADTYIWSPSNGLNNTTDSIQNAQPNTTTNYQVIASDKVGCFKDTGYVKITVFPIPTVEAGIDRKINVGQSIDLIPIISSDVTEVIWQPTDGLTRNTFPSITVRPNQTTDYTVEAKNVGGCLAKDKVTVFVVCNGGNVFIPNTFSPNGDGVNDVFYPRGTGLFKIKSFNIFSRWGEKMFEKNSFDANDPSFGWDGTFKGTKLTPDVFIYSIEIICSNNTVLLYRGNVALVK